MSFSFFLFSQVLALVTEVAVLRCLNNLQGPITCAVMLASTFSHCVEFLIQMVASVNKFIFNLFEKLMAIQVSDFYLKSRFWIPTWLGFKNVADYYFQEISVKIHGGCFALQMMFYSGLQIQFKPWTDNGLWCLLYFSRYVWGGVWHSLKNGHVPGRNSWEDEGEGKTYTHCTRLAQRACRVF